MATLTLDDIRHLTPRERLDLIGALWDSLTDTEVTLPSSQRAELERRLASFEEDRQEVVTWEKLKAELAARAP